MSNSDSDDGPPQAPDISETIIRIGRSKPTEGELRRWKGMNYVYKPPPTLVLEDLNLTTKTSKLTMDNLNNFLKEIEKFKTGERKRRVPRKKLFLKGIGGGISSSQFREQRNKLEKKKKVFKLDESKVNEHFEKLKLEKLEKGKVEELDSKYLTLPCHLIDGSQNTSIKNYDFDKWSKIKIALRNPIQSLEELNACFKFIHNSNYLNFLDLTLINQHLNGETEDFLVIIQKLQKIILNMPNLFKANSIPLLLSNDKIENQIVSLTKLQIRCLIASSFFGILINTFDYNSNEFSYLNFDKNSFKFKVGMNKFKCLLNYFKRITSKSAEKSLNNTVVLTRRILNTFPDYSKSTKSFSNLIIASNKPIDEMSGHLKVSFAGKFLGGRLLTSGVSIDEINFTIQPEMMISMIICSKIKDNETLFIKGAEKFSKYKGIGERFEYLGDYNDTNDVKNGVLDNEYVEMDGLSGSSSLSISMLNREINKSYISFSKKDDKVIATGNWNCSNFGTQKELKLLIQVLAASEAGKDISFSIFGNKMFTTQVLIAFKVIKSKNIKVNQIYQLLLKIFENPKSAKFVSIFDQLKNLLN